MQISLNLEVCRGNRVDRRKTFDSKIFYDQHNKFSVEINCYHRVRFHSYQRRTCFKYVSVVTKRNVSQLYVIHQSC